MPKGETAMSPDELQNKDQALFIQLVLTFQAAAIQQMGKLQNPITGKVERDLEQAKFSIDMLEMIENRTRGNLSEDEKEFLEHALFELRMNYVDEVKRDEEEKKKAGSAGSQPERPKASPDSSTQNEQKTEEKNAPDKQAPPQ
jgi:hypothetical protein